MATEITDLHPDLKRQSAQALDIVTQVVVVELIKHAFANMAADDKAVFTNRVREDTGAITALIVSRAAPQLKPIALEIQEITKDLAEKILKLAKGE